MAEDQANAPMPEPIEAPEDGAVKVFEDLEKLREERDKFLELLQRTRADFDNYQKRIQRDQEQERRYLHTQLVKDLLPALDNLERALAAATEPSNLSRGIEMVQTQLLDALKRHGVTAIEASGKPFDPHFHQAVMEQPSAELPPGTVLQVLQRGYQYHDRVLRPCSVVVSRAP